VTATIRKSSGSPAATVSPVQSSGLSLVQADCCVCGDEDADPVAVGRDFGAGGGPDTFLARRCRGCGLVYLDPAPSADSADGLLRALRGPPAKSVHRWLKSYPGAARVLRIDDPQQEAMSGPGGYDLILLDHSLERALAPRRLLLSARALLAPGGRVIVITHNTDSLAFRLFGGRHWCGYEFPRHRSLFAAAPLRALVRSIGMEVVSLTTSSYPAGWLRSLRNVGVDWGLPSPVMRALPAALPACAALEAFGRLRGRGGLLVAELLRSPGTADGRKTRA
jgi:hypothetical protein